MKNYCPISNQPLLEKLIEMVAASQLIEHIKKCSFLHQYQSAYCRNHSTESPMLMVSNSWRAALDQRKVVCIASLDVMATFDMISHKTLCAWLETAGVLGQASQWFKSYLSGQQAIVMYNKT